MIFLQLKQRCVRNWLCCVSWNIVMSWIMSHHEFFHCWGWQCRRRISGDLMRQPCNGAVRCSGSLKWPPADCLVAKWSFSSWNKGVLGVDYAAFFETLLCHESCVIMSFFTAEDDNANARYARSDPSDLQHCQWSVVVDVGFSFTRVFFTGFFEWGYHMIK